MHYQPEDAKWQVGAHAALIHELRERLPEGEYENQKRALKEFLCGYFSTDSGCRTAQGNSIAPLKATPKGGKVLKVRWAYPGCGKSGSLRLVFVAYCDELRVHIAQAFDRRDDLGDDDISDSVADY